MKALASGASTVVLYEGEPATGSAAALGITGMCEVRLTTNGRAQAAKCGVAKSYLSCSFYCFPNMETDQVFSSTCDLRTALNGASSPFRDRRGSRYDHKVVLAGYDSYITKAGFQSPFPATRKPAHSVWKICTNPSGSAGSESGQNGEATPFLRKESQCVCGAR